MTFTHTDIEERLIDFLYGELDAEARAAFDAHITACDACRSEVRAFEQTRAAARAVVRAPLEHPVPAAVRARVMDAAARATAARGIAGHAPAPNVAGPRTRVADGWFAWLRARWALPMFATVAAIGALLLVRETIFREARRPLGEAPPADLVPQGAAPPSEIAPRAREGGDQADKAVAAPRSAKRAASPISSGHAPPDADRYAATKEIGAATGGAENVRVGAGKHRRGSPVQAAKEAAEPPALAQPQQSQPRATTRGPSEGPSSSSAAAAVEGEPSPGARKAEARPATREREREDEDEKEPAPRPARRSVPRILEVPSAADAPAPAPDTAAESASSVPTPDPTAALIDRAEKLMAAQRWNDAALAYRGLIQRFPGHASAPAWRRRLAAAEAAAARDDQHFATPPPPR